LFCFFSSCFVSFHLVLFLFILFVSFHLVRLVSSRFFPKKQPVCFVSFHHIFSKKQLFVFLVIFLAEISIFEFVRCFASPNSENGGRFYVFGLIHSFFACYVFLSFSACYVFSFLSVCCPFILSFFVYSSHTSGAYAAPLKTK